MTTLQTVRPELPPARGNVPAPPGTVIIGWLMLIFAIIPLTIAAGGDGGVYTSSALGMIIIGAALVVIPRLRRPRGTKPGSPGPA